MYIHDKASAEKHNNEALKKTFTLGNCKVLLASAILSEKKKKRASDKYDKYYPTRR